MPRVGKDDDLRLQGVRPEEEHSVTAIKRLDFIYLGILSAEELVARPVGLLAFLVAVPDTFATRAQVNVV
jgi:hypothetical protein